MPTPAEQKALTFFALVVLLGGAVRIVRGGVPTAGPPSPAEQQALARQAFAASSVAAPGARQRASGSRKQSQKAQKRRYAGAKFDSTGLLVDGSGLSSASLSPNGFPPPGPRIDIGASAGKHPSGWSGPAPLVDLDLADTTQIARLPGISRAVARRIVANRDSLGPFGALPALRRVNGVGPATLKRLAGLVTFSGQARR